ncbi:putative DNA-binding domain-containing protein [Salipiger sp. P9]|uniref:HvfC/BufC N-terminal domain-containing protein n=1 Tax=Salipiger pentaromativorans TaxID=2943193 RepID=UPI002157A2F1|nr:DNA-binding domain-containing protein [Salipiger pentaromativorans]MCR8547220.1 putative DNA-binding domain-containing protein [Salipiger pentaromativorans]
MTQRAFHQALLDARRPVPPALTDGAGRPAGRRYAVYRNNVAVSLTEALASGFPACAALLGEANFARVAGRFLRQHPPATPVILHYGAQFPAFLDGLDGLARLPFLADVARLELALRRAYHAADAPPVAPEALAALSAPALSAARLRLAPAVQLVRAPWPIAEIRAYALGQTARKPQGGAQEVIVLRPGYDPAAHVLPARGHVFVSALQAGMALASASLQGGPGFDPTDTLALLLAHGAITRIDTGEPA